MVSTSAQMATEEKVICPTDLKLQFPRTSEMTDLVRGYREQIERILSGDDKRLIVVAGPCSISNTEDSLEYAERLKELGERISDKIFLVMRTYFEKPRSVLGWKGLLYDPFLDDSYDIGKGLEITRKLLLEINKIGVPCGTEFLSSHVPKYIGDLVSWAAIGARTSESQGHREFSSRLSMPVGFKNGVAGTVKVAINGILSAKSKHHYLGVAEDGGFVKINTKGNSFTHLILRGGNEPNYDEASVADIRQQLIDVGLDTRLMIDCSHGNSGKNYREQGNVFADVIRQRVAGNTNIIGLMLESNLFEGSQDVSGDSKGISMTDDCIGWSETETLIINAYKLLS
ncbi:MAG: 3-deoxy-7-phosphoheptulonate synthase [Patescibacteria group bacterium]|jgi:3-deoxy-7-phosphoheptulonate synthase